MPFKFKGLGITKTKWELQLRISSLLPQMFCMFITSCLGGFCIQCLHNTHRNPELHTHRNNTYYTNILLNSTIRCMPMVSLIWVTASLWSWEHYTANYEIILFSRLNTDERNQIRKAYRAILQKAVLRSKSPSQSWKESPLG